LLGLSHPSSPYLKRRVARDVVLLVALFGPILALSVYFDVFDRFAGFVRTHKVWGLEEFIATIFFLGFGLLIFALRRVSDLRGLEERARHLAREDELTGLPNRRRFLEELGTWKATLEEDQACVVFLIDLNQFKPVNDLYGHRLGDEVLRTTAQRLKRIAGDRALVARIGGDEFGILMPMVSDPEAPQRVAERIIQEIPQPIRLATLEVKVGVSVGIAFCKQSKGTTILTDQDGGEIETVLRQADMALYQAKARGRSGYHFFCQAMDEELRSRIELEREIDGAIKSGRPLLPALGRS
jgi:diguanylate cyclase (GGDEF)-like protein